MRQIIRHIHATQPALQINVEDALDAAAKPCSIILQSIQRSRAPNSSSNKAKNSGTLCLLEYRCCGDPIDSSQRPQ